MKISVNSKVALQLIALLIIMGGGVFLTLNNLLHPLAFVFVVIVCSPWISNLYRDIRKMQFDNVRKLKKYLPKIGCIVESVEPEKGGENVRIIGKFKNETLIFDTSSNNAYVFIWDPAWLRVPASDPNIPKFMEAINATNIQSGPTVVFSSPDEQGIRSIHTLCSTIVPNQYIPNFLNVTLIQVLNKKTELQANFKDYPWLAPQRQNPIGFATTATAPRDENKENEVVVN